MRAGAKGLLVAALHLALVGSLGAKLLWDRATLPRAWVRVRTVDPDLPIRGRYLRLQVMLEARDVHPEGEGPRAAAGASAPPPASEAAVPGAGAARAPLLAGRVTFAVRDGRLAATVHAGTASGLQPPTWLRPLAGADAGWVALGDDVAFYLPEHARDPSRPPPGQTLWMEATVPAAGPPRPIRLGVRAGDGPVRPLALDGPT